jgi:hypothetical protein
MTERRGAVGLRGSIALRAIRRDLTERRAWPVVGVLAVAFAAISMILGQMLILEPVSGPVLVGAVLPSGGGHLWDFPELYAVGPWGVLVLPFLPTVAMALVSVGVGMGATVAAGQVATRLRRDPARPMSPTGVAVGAGPAIGGLATIGACCCTACASTAGVAVVAAASGVGPAELLVNDWYVGVFQLVLVCVTLVALDRSLAGVVGRCPSEVVRPRRQAAGALLRLALVVAGVTWSLAMLVEWGSVDPLTAAPAQWYHWGIEHQLLGAAAVAAGLFPSEFAGFVRRHARTFGGLVGRVALGAGAVSWGLWVPAPFVAAGLGGFMNELFGTLGAPAGWGAVAPDAALGPALLFHWAFQHLLLATFALALAIRPLDATVPVTWGATGPVAPAGGIPPASRPTPVAEA